MQNARTVLAGSERKKIPNRQTIPGAAGTPHPEEIITVTVVIRSKDPVPTALLHSGLYRPDMFSRETIAAMHGATAMDMLTVRSFLESHHLQVLKEDPLLCYIKTSGTIRNMEAAFGTALRHVRVGRHIYRERVGALTIPGTLAGIVIGAHGLDNRPQARSHIRPAATAPAGYSPTQIAALYKFPTGDGSGQKIGIIELGGGFVQADLKTYFSTLHLPTPVVIAKSVDGAQNKPTNDPNGPDGEVMLDIEVAGAIAPKATINVYFAGNTDQGFLDAIHQAITDQVTVISISWGSAEVLWSQMSMTNFDLAFQKAALLGIHVTVASGDNGSSDLEPFDNTQTYGADDLVRFTDNNIYKCLIDGTVNILPGDTTHWTSVIPPPLAVDFPAASPNVLSCGGTSLQGSSSITSETVWNSAGGDGYRFAPGGGVSGFFKKPTYQQNVDIPTPPPGGGGRGVPDISGNADPETGYKVRVDGNNSVIGGTSAGAPLWAGLIAILTQRTGKKLPFLNTLLYQTPKALNDIRSGTNDVGPGDGKYQASQGWDACTGMGSPIGAAILTALQPVSPTPPPDPGSGSTGGTGSTGEQEKKEYPSLAPARSNPIVREEMPVEEGSVIETSIEAESIVAIMGMASNIAETAITAITALARIKKNS